MLNAAQNIDREPSLLSSRRRIVIGAGALVGALLAGSSPLRAQAPAPAPKGPYQLPPLPYEAGALEPTIDRETMTIHHGRHHQAYVDATNRALADYPQLQGRRIEDLLRGLNEVPEAIRATIRNQGGGHANHSLFWKTMTPNGSAMPEGLRKQIDADFGSLDAMKTKFEEAGARQFGSGWVFVVLDDKGAKLDIKSYPNQDGPLMEGKLPLLGNDVWEHAYYLKYKNARAAYLKAWWNVVHWAHVGERLAAIRAGKVEL